MSRSQTQFDVSDVFHNHPTDPSPRSNSTFPDVSFPSPAGGTFLIATSDFADNSCPEESNDSTTRPINSHEYHFTYAEEGHKTETHRVLSSHEYGEFHGQTYHSQWPPMISTNTCFSGHRPQGPHQCLHLLVRIAVVFVVCFFHFYLLHFLYSGGIQICLNPARENWNIGSPRLSLWKTFARRIPSFNYSQPS